MPVKSWRSTRAGRKRELPVGSGAAPTGEGADVIIRNHKAIDATEQVLEDNADGERQALHLAETELGEALQAVVGKRTERCLQCCERAHGVVGHAWPPRSILR
jgi:hypothetical protein